MKEEKSSKFSFEWIVHSGGRIDRFEERKKRSFSAEKKEQKDKNRLEPDGRKSARANRRMASSRSAADQSSADQVAEWLWEFNDENVFT